MIHDFTSTDDLPTSTPWTVHGSESVLSSPWVSVDLVDVEPPEGERYTHHAVRVPYEAVCVVVEHRERGVLLLWRHRFIPDTAGFEVPAGRVEKGETILDAAAREVLEETGWSIESPKLFSVGNASDGVSDQRFHFVYATAGREVAEVVDSYESDRLYWVPVDQLAGLVRDGYVPGCPAMFAILYAITFGLLHAPT